MKRTFVVGAMTVLALSASPALWADSPPNLETPDAHSVPAKGKITLYRIQVAGLGIGTGENKTEAELMVTLDNDPKMVYTLRLDPTAPPANQAIADTLRDAYISNTPVTLYRQIAPGKNIFKIHMVQLEK